DGEPYTETANIAKAIITAGEFTNFYVQTSERQPNKLQNLNPDRSTDLFGKMDDLVSEAHLLRWVSWHYGYAPVMSFHNLGYFRVLRQVGKLALAAIVLIARPPGHPISRLDEMTAVFIRQPDIPGFPTPKQLRETVFWVNMVAIGMIWILDPDKYFDRTEAVKHKQKRRFAFHSMRSVFDDSLVLQMSMDPHLGTGFVWPMPLHVARPIMQVSVKNMCEAYMAAQLTHGKAGWTYNAVTWHEQQPAIMKISKLGGCRTAIWLRALNYYGFYKLQPIADQYGVKHGNDRYQMPW
ncbi:MAG: hypothetical protein GY696_38630, partial [Gammaproteobacteria bacterium]|nr:hypothetical protein [Gammaproteobacteria bacterium]